MDDFKIRNAKQAEKMVKHYLKKPGTATRYDIMEHKRFKLFEIENILKDLKNVGLLNEDNSEKLRLI